VEITKNLKMRRLLLIGCVLVGSCLGDGTPSRNYFRLGNARDAGSTPTPGFALMGGGSDLDAAFRWLCEHANGGDFLILRARGDDEYNAYVNGLCRVNSVSTLIIPDRTAANNPKVAEIIHSAEAIFIAGGDQARYINYWTDTPVQRELNSAIKRGVPIGGTSAGLAVLGSYVYTAQNDQPDGSNLSSAAALMNPFHEQITLKRNFMEIPLLRNTLTDTHFKGRDRMGRTLVFLARIVQSGWSSNPRAIAIDEKAAVLVEADGKASVVGFSTAYFLQVKTAPEVCRSGQPLTFRNISVYRVAAGGQFDLSEWEASRGTSYSVEVDNGVIHSTQAGGSAY
jgi:cyanophycinase